MILRIPSGAGIYHTTCLDLRAIARMNEGIRDPNVRKKADRVLEWATRLNVAETLKGQDTVEPEQDDPEVIAEPMDEATCEEPRREITPTRSFTFPVSQTEVRQFTREDGVQCFVAADVCGCLDLGSPHKAIGRLDDDEKGRTTIPTLGGIQDVTYITEPGLYALILTSRQERAKAFKRWVTHEVLPSIRKTGSYSATIGPAVDTGGDPQLPEHLGPNLGR